MIIFMVFDMYSQTAFHQKVVIFYTTPEMKESYFLLTLHDIVHLPFKHYHCYRGMMVII